MKLSSCKAGCARLAKVLVRGFYSSSIVKNRVLDVGDYFERSVHAVVHRDPRSTAAVLLHEIVEKLLTDYAGIPWQQVDKDDAAVLAGTLKHSKVCYIRQHRIAARIERIFVEELGLSWEAHDRNVNAAFAEQEKFHGHAEADSHS